MSANHPKTSLAQAMSERLSVDGVTYKIASCREEREDAFRLIHDAYVKSGLMTPNKTRMRVTPFHLLPTTDLFIAYHNGNVIYTMTLISDDQMGIPLEAVYGSEVDQRRRASGAYFAEVSCLASRTGYFNRNRMFNVFVQLAALMVQSARENGVQRLLVACNPRHARFYQSYLGFSQIGDQKVYGQVCNKPAVALEHDFEKLDQQSYPLRDRIYAAPLRHWELYHQPMLREEAFYFSEVAGLCAEHFPLEAVS
ncbi:N-acyl amino acid synthase FeeM domain-containing protein [Rhodopirellula sp. JC639]|uniref:N-acyl amino acid synthase FeeM domain-containing protein n=1 Tax=Stieleria mannarensis TaxID=2755585 RepID=UPI0016008086|nr:hypothetical protein [Rhodopirellula sp. JC639]